MKYRKQKKGENIWHYWDYIVRKNNTVRYFSPHINWVAFRLNKGHRGFVKFDWDCWGLEFYKKGWCPVDTEMKREIEGENPSVKLVWIPVSFSMWLKMTFVGGNYEM